MSACDAGLKADSAAARTNENGTDPFSVLDEKLAPDESAVLKLWIQNTLHAFSYNEATGSWYARNGANQITFTYMQDGTALFSGTGNAFGLTSGGIGRGDTLSPAGSGIARASGRLLEISRPAYTEWYRNNDNGVEQGVTIRSRPTGDGPLLVRFGVAGNATISRDNDQTLTIMDASGKPLFIYTGLHAFSADCRELPTSLVTDGTTLTWVVDDTRAVYPVTIDPVVVSASAATARFTGGAAGDQFGRSVALSSDGTTVLVGAWQNDTAGVTNAGAAYIFEKGGGWSSKSASAATAQFTGGATSDQFGYSVALSSDGTTALVGAITNDTAFSEAGAAYIFEKGGGWSSKSASAATAQFTGSAEDDEFGYSVALSSDGTTALVGAWRNDTAFSDAGAAYIFEKGGGWSSKSASAATAQLTGGAASDRFGTSVSLSSDGTTALVGAIYNDTAFTDAGAAYIFGKGGGWSSTSASSATARFTGGADEDNFGYSVALSSDGKTALVGAWQNDTPGNANAGAAYIFGKGGGWSSTSASAATARFTGGAAGDNFGNSVSLSSDGTTAFIGANYNDAAFSNAGAAYIFGSPFTTLTAGGTTTGTTGTSVNGLTLNPTGTLTNVDLFLGTSASAVSGTAIKTNIPSLPVSTATTVDGVDLTGKTAGTYYLIVNETGTTTLLGATSSAVYTVTGGAPAVTSINPSSGTTAGGTSVTVTGTGFTGATAVKFGATNAASYTVNSATQITATSPAGSAGTVDITVTTAGGTSATGAADQFTYTTATPTPTPTPANNGGSDGGSDSSSGSSNSPTASTVSSIVSGQPATFSFNQNPTVTSPVALDQVQIVFNQNRGAVEVIGGTVGYGGSLPGQDVIGVITVELVGLNPNVVGTAIISFSVNGQYLRDHHIDPAQVTLMRNHDGQWSPLAGSLVGQTGDTYNYEARTTGFSYFAVVAPNAGTAANTTMASTLTNSTTSGDLVVITAPVTVPVTPLVVRSTVVTVPVTSATTAVPAALGPNPGIPVIVIEGIVVLLAVIGGAFLVRRWWIRRQNPALFEKYN